MPAEVRKPGFACAPRGFRAAGQSQMLVKRLLPRKIKDFINFNIIEILLYIALKQYYCYFNIALKQYYCIILLFLKYRPEAIILLYIEILL